MTTYVLLITYTVGVFSSGGISSDSERFDDFQACVYAAETMSRTVEGKFGNSVGVAWSCTPVKRQDWMPSMMKYVG